MPRSIDLTKADQENGGCETGAGGGRISRRSLLGAALASTLGLALGATDAPAAAGKKPNFVFILTDDQRFDALGAAGNRFIQTPNLDALAARGIRFANAFVTCSICSPSRAACLTGRYGSANGVMKLEQAINPGEQTFATHLKEKLGYRTGIIGKWHVKNAPKSLGFDMAVRFPGNGPYRNRRVDDQGRPLQVKGYIDTFCTGRALGFIDEARQAGSPFALFFCTQAPHMPWNPRPETLARYEKMEIPPPATWRDDLAGKPPYLKTARFRTRAHDEYGYGDPAKIVDHCRHYYAAITELDQALGRLLKRLEEPELRENTYVILMGDNGWLLGEHGLTSKVLPYEESMRVPLLIAGPGIKPGTDERLVLNIDLAPTMLALAGLEPPAAMHGRSLAPLLRREPAPAWRRSFFYEAPLPELESWPLRAVRTERYKYVQTFDVKEPGKLVFEELYDLREDPAEMKNLAARPEQAARLAELHQEMARLRRGLPSAGVGSAGTGA